MSPTINGQSLPLTPLPDVPGSVAQPKGQPQTLLGEEAQAILALKNIADQVVERSGATVAREGIAPQLAPPKPVMISGQSNEKSPLSGNASLTELLGRLIDILSNISVHELKARLAHFTQRMANDQQTLMALSEEYQQVVAQCEQATQAFDQAVGQAESAKQLAQQADKTLKQASDTLASLSPTDPDRAAYQQAVVDAQRNADTAKLAYDTAHSAMGPALAQVQLANQLADKVLAGATSIVPQRYADQQRNTSLQLIDIMAHMMLLVEQSNDQELNRQLETARKLEIGRQERMQQQANEYSAKLRKQEELQNVMGWIGKVLGGVLMVLGVLGAAFSGGASLALTAFGIALTIIDRVVKAATGVSLIEKAMRPLTQLMQKMAEYLGGEIAKALEGMGVSKDKAMLVGNIIGAVVSAVAVVVVMVVGTFVAKGLLSSFGSMLSKLIGDTITKLIPQVLKNIANRSIALASQTSARLAKALHLKADPASLAQYGQTLERANIMLAGGTQLTQGSLEVAVGVYRKKASDHKAAIVKDSALHETLEEMLKQVLVVYAQKTSAANEVIGHLDDALKGILSTIDQVIRRIPV